MAKGPGVERRIPPLRWRDALFRFGGWGGEAEVSFTRFFSQRVFFIMLWGTVWRNMGGVYMIMLRHKSILAGAVVCLSFSQIRHFMPMLLLLPPLRMFNSSNCVSWGLLSLLWRLISKSEVAFGFVAPFVILNRMQTTHVDIIFNVLYYPLTEPMKNMPLAFFIHLFSIPIDANIGMHTGTRMDYLRATVVNMLALLVRMLFAIHQRREFTRQQTLMLVEEDRAASSSADEHLLTSIHGGSTSTHTAAIMAGSVTDMEEEELADYESGSSDAEYDEPLRGLEHMMVNCMDEDMDNYLAIGCVPAISEEQAIERGLKDMHNFGVEYGCMSSAIPVTVYIPWSNPDDLGANAINNVKSKLQELLPDYRLLGTTVRKGSLILTFNLIYVGASPEVGQLEQIQSMVPTQSWVQWLDLPWPKDGEEVMVQSMLRTQLWVQWLDLPWPKDGEEVMVQVGDQHAVGVSWNFNDQCWAVGKAAVVDATLHPVKITSVEPQVLCLPTSKEPIQLTIGVLCLPTSKEPIQLTVGVLCLPTSKEPIQLTIGVNTEVVKDLLNPNSNLHPHPTPPQPPSSQVLRLPPSKEPIQLTIGLKTEVVIRLPTSKEPIQLTIGVLRLPTSKEPIQLTIGVNTEVVKDLLNPNSNLHPLPPPQPPSSQVLCLPTSEEPIQLTIGVLCLPTSKEPIQLTTGVLCLPPSKEPIQLTIGVLRLPTSKEPIQLTIGVNTEVVKDLLNPNSNLHPHPTPPQPPSSQVLRLPPSKEPIQLTIGLNTEVVRELRNPNSNLQLRARYMNRALPLDLHPPLDTGKIGYTPAALAGKVNKAREQKPSSETRGSVSLKNGAVRGASPLSGGMPRATSLSPAPRATVSIEKGVVPATDNMHTAKGVVPATDSMHTDLGDVPRATSLSQASRASVCLHAGKGVVPATDSMHIEKGGVPATDSMCIQKGGAAPEASPCHTRMSPAGTSSGDSDSTEIIETPVKSKHPKRCLQDSAIMSKAFDESETMAKIGSAKAGAAELNAEVKSSSVKQKVKSLVRRLGFKIKRTQVDV
eukprot:gene12276-15422_t